MAPPWQRDRVLAGGATIVAPSEAHGLVWSRPHATTELVEVLGTAPSIRWVQLPFAGVENFAEAGVFHDGRTWACGKGVYAEEVAEHVVALSLAALRCIPERVRARSWGQRTGTSLLGENVCILGGGGITESLLRLLQPFGTVATVVRRDPTRALPGASEVVGPDGLHAAVADALVVVVALSLTPETEHVVDAGLLRAMRPDAWLVNVGRGRHVDTDALVHALRTGEIAGAALDVTEPEPLPDGHPLWDLPNVIITPHAANTPEMAQEPLGRRIEENVRRSIAGEPLIGLVDPRLGY